MLSLIVKLKDIKKENIKHLLNKILKLKSDVDKHN
jgi:hypothetical protein